MFSSTLSYLLGLERTALVGGGMGAAAGYLIAKNVEQTKDNKLMVVGALLAGALVGAGLALKYTYIQETWYAASGATVKTPASFGEKGTELKPVLSHKK